MERMENQVKLDHREKEETREVQGPLAHQVNQEVQVCVVSLEDRDLTENQAEEALTVNPVHLDSQDPQVTQDNPDSQVFQELKENQAKPDPQVHLVHKVQEVKPDLRVSQVHQAQEEVQV